MKPGLPGNTRASRVLSAHLGQAGRSEIGRFGMVAHAGSGVSITELTVTDKSRGRGGDGTTVRPIQGQEKHTSEHSRELLRTAPLP